MAASTSQDTLLFTRHGTRSRVTVVQRLRSGRLEARALEDPQMFGPHVRDVMVAPRSPRLLHWRQFVSCVRPKCPNAVAPASASQPYFLMDSSSCPLLHPKEMAREVFPRTDGVGVGVA